MGGLSKLAAALNDIHTSAGRLKIARMLSSSVTQNTFIGQSAGDSVTTASMNTGLGYFALRHVSAGIQNTAMGEQAMGDHDGNYNTAVGAESLKGVNGGNNNVGVGIYSGNTITSGSNMAAIGYAAGDGITTGDHCTFIGSHSKTTTGGLTYGTAIGADAVVNTNNQVVLGRSSDTVSVPGSLILANYTVATLPASPVLGQMAVVSDGAAALAWGANIASGGTAKYLVWYNGSRWTVLGQ